MTLASDTADMDREDLTDRLPTDRIPLGRVPGLGSETEPESIDTFDEATAPPETATKMGETRGDAETEDKSVADSANAPADNERLSRRERARKVLLGVSIGGAVLAVVAAVLRRLLGDESEEDEESADAEPKAEQPEPAPDAEAVAAVIGLAFQLLVRRLVGEGDSRA